MTAVAATKGKTAVLEATGDEATGKVYTVANGSIFAEGDTIVIRNNGKVTATTRLPWYRAIPSLGCTGERGSDRQVPGSEKVLSTCEMNLEVSYRDQVELYEGVSLNQSSASFITKVLANQSWWM